MTARNSTIKLDWNRLLGFDQISNPATSCNNSAIKDSRLAKVGAKIGAKGGFKLEVQASPELT